MGLGAAGGLPPVRVEARAAGDDVQRLEEYVVGRDRLTRHPAFEDRRLDAEALGKGLPPPRVFAARTRVRVAADPVGASLTFHHSTVRRGQSIGTMAATP